MFFDSLCQRLISKRKTGHLAASPLVFDFFSNISWFINILSLKSFSKSWGKSCNKFLMLDIKHRFTCSDSDLSQVIKMCQNIMTKIVCKFSFARSSSNDDSTFRKKYQLCFKFWRKVCFLKQFQAITWAQTKQIQ